MISTNTPSSTARAYDQSVVEDALKAAYPDFLWVVEPLSVPDAGGCDGFGISAFYPGDDAPAHYEEVYCVEGQWIVAHCDEDRDEWVAIERREEGDPYDPELVTGSLEEVAEQTDQFDDPVDAVLFIITAGGSEPISSEDEEG